MLRLIRSGATPIITDCIRQCRHAERVAMRWTPCPVMERLAHHAEQDYRTLRQRISASIERDRRARQAMMARWHEEDLEQENRRALAAWATRAASARH